MRAKTYIGIPYKSKGRSFDGCDCYGLIYLVYALENNLWMETYGETYNSAEDVESACAALLDNRCDWVKIEESEVRPLDVILLKVRGYAAHVGVVVDPKRKEFLHTLAGHNSALDNYGRLAWKRRIEGFYRHKDA